jgi:hypothetical protein
MPAPQGLEVCWSTKSLVRPIVGAMSGTGNWSIAEAFGAAVSGGVVLLGAIAALRYLRRADASIEAEYFPCPQAAGLHISPCIRSAGLVRLRLDRENQRLQPQVIVTPVHFREGQEVPGEGQRRPCLKDDYVLDPGEKTTGSEVFIFPVPAPDQIGWRAIFLFTVKKRLPRIDGEFRAWPLKVHLEIKRVRWFWAAQTFVPVPAAGGPAAAGGGVEGVRVASANE